VYVNWRVLALRCAMLRSIVYLPNCASILLEESLSSDQFQLAVREPHAPCS
jgi:hypothetical protein